MAGKKSGVDLIKFSTIPIDFHVDISLPKTFDVKQLKKKLGLKDTVDSQKIISIVGETIILEDNDNTNDLVLTEAVIGYDQFKQLYNVKDDDTDKDLINAFKIMFPMSKASYSISSFKTPCDKKGRFNADLSDKIILSLEHRANILRNVIVRDNPSSELFIDNVEIRSKLTHFNNLNKLLISLQEKHTAGECSGEDKREKKKELDVDEFLLLLRQFAFFLLLAKTEGVSRDAIDPNDILNVFPDYKDQLAYIASSQPRGTFTNIPLSVQKLLKEAAYYKEPKGEEGEEELKGGSRLKIDLEEIDTEMKTLSESIQSLELNDSPSKKEKRELLKKQKELATLSKKRVALEEKLSEEEQNATFRVNIKDIPHMADALYPKLRNSRFLKFKRELDKKLLRVD
jgi:hypothetical protein